jgi:hypothetical protein
MENLSRALFCHWPPHFHNRATSGKQRQTYNRNVARVLLTVDNVLQGLEGGFACEGFIRGIELRVVGVNS